MLYVEGKAMGKGQGMILASLGASYGLLEQDGECVCCLEEEGKLHSLELLKAFTKNEACS